MEADTDNLTHTTVVKMALSTHAQALMPTHDGTKHSLIVTQVQSENYSILSEFLNGCDTLLHPCRWEHFGCHKLSVTSA